MYKIYTGLRGGKYYIKNNKKIYIKQRGGGIQYNIILLDIKMNRGSKSIINCKCILTLNEKEILITPPSNNSCKLGNNKYNDIIKIERDEFKQKLYTYNNTFKKLNNSIIILSYNEKLYNIKFKSFEKCMDFMEKL